MSHQKDCHQFIAGILHPSGGRIGPLVGAPEEAARHFDPVAGHSTPQRRLPLRLNMVSLKMTAPDVKEIDEIVAVGVATLYRLFNMIVSS